MGCNLSQEEREKKRYQVIASKLPFIKGTIIREDGTTFDISELFDLPVSEADPQLAKAQTFTPFIKNTIILQDGRTCSLLDLIEKILSLIDSASVVYTEELRLTHVELTSKDWGDSGDTDVPSIDDLDFYPYRLKEEDWKWQ